jgi:hypothetical protein
VTTTRERFEMKYIPEPNSGCWLWTSTVSTRGYGLFKLDRRQQFAHRVAWSLANDREIPQGLVVRHRCDTPTCVNPDHLELGTHADNAKDRDSRGHNGFSNKTHCPSGHEYAGANVRINADGSRHCRTCMHNRRTEGRETKSHKEARHG